MTTFTHTGKIGDLIYALPTIRACGGGILYLREGETEHMTTEARDSIIPLLELQPYIHKVEIRNDAVDVNLDLWRSHYSKHTNIAEMCLNIFGFAPIHCQSAWLEVASLQVSKVVIHRSGRYSNPKFPWKKVVAKYRNDAVFVGLEEEYHDFVKIAGEISFVKPQNHLELAQIIKGAELFVGNQSSPYSIAEGLKQNTVLEVWPKWGNCNFNRPNAIMGRNQHVFIPDLPLVNCLI